MEKITLVRRLNSIIEIKRTPTSVSCIEIARFINGSWYTINKNATEYDVCDLDTAKKYDIIKKDGWKFLDKCRECPLFMISTNNEK